MSDPGPGAPPAPAAAPDPARARMQRAWCLYDWANSAFATSVVAAILPVYFAGVAAKTMAPHQATALWGYASAAALAVTAVLSPIAGALADQTRRRKPYLLACVLLGVAGTFALSAIPGQPWWGLLVAFGIAFIAFATGNVLYDSLLPGIAHDSEMHAVSARGFALGYLGGGLLLAAHLVLVLKPKLFGLPDAAAATRVAFASVAAWWLVFSLPIFRDVPEPEAGSHGVPAAQLAGATFAQLGRTLAHIAERRDLLLFLVAFWLYSDGIGTIIKMATIYGAEVGIGQKDLIGALLMVQLVAAPASLAFGRLAKPLGPKRAVMLGLAGYCGISVFAFFLQKPWHFWMQALLVALFQGGTQALSRSMFASLVSKRQVSELFGFYSVSEKLAGVVGPVLFAGVTQLTGGGRLATLTLLPLFLGGAWLLSRVDLERGARRAQADGAGA